MTTPTPASMGGPLSEAERIAEIQARLDALDAKIKLRAENAKRGIVTPLGSAADRLHQYAPMDLEYLLERVGVLEGQLATARELHKRERRYTLGDENGSWARAEDCASDLEIRVDQVQHFDICTHCGDMEQQDDELRDFRESLWPCDTARALGLDGGRSDDE